MLLAPASGPGIGGGHLMRCLTLAEALRARGLACALRVGEAGADLARRFGGDAYEVLSAPVEVLLQQRRFDAVIIDDYAIGLQDERRWRAHVRTLAVIDDLADRPHACDLLIDPGYGRDDRDYSGLVPAEAKLLTGPAFAPIRPGFAALRGGALARPLAPEPRRAFVSFGLSDVEGVAARAIVLIRARHPALPLDVALSADAVSLNALQARAASDPNLHLHVDTPHVAPLMAGADMAVGAGGASTWERACLGLPTLAVIVADNQRTMIQTMAADGAVLAVDLHGGEFDAAFDDALLTLGDAAVRTAMGNRSAALCDGLGAARIADALVAL